MKARQRHGSAEQALATTQQCIKSSAVRDDETMDQEGARELETAYCGQSPVCFLLFHVNETLASCLTTLEVDVGTFDEHTACEL